MRKATTALFVVLMFVFSCTKESVTPDLDSGDNVLKKAPAAEKVTKTLKFHESSGILLYYADPLVPCVICDNCISYAQLLVQGTGHATHLGAFTVINYMCYDDYITRGILTAANGDQVWTELEGDPVDGVFHYIIKGGTGRFEGASGDIYMWGDIVFNPDGTGTFDLVCEGKIKY